MKRIRFPVANSLRSIPIALSFWFLLGGAVEINLVSFLTFGLIFVAAYLANWHGHFIRGKRGERISFPVSLLLGFLFVIHSAFLLAVMAVSMGSGEFGVFVALFFTYTLYFMVLLFIPSVPLFFFLNKWRPEQDKLEGVTF